MQRIVGIDLGATAVKAVAIESGFRAHTISGYRAEPVPPAVGSEPKPYVERVKPALEAMARDNWFHADNIICCVPGAQVATHHISLPFTDRKQIEATLPSEVEDLIPFNMEDVVFDWHILSRAPGRTEVLVAVALKRDVSAVLEALKTVNVDPAIVTFAALSLSNLHAEGYVSAPPPKPVPVPDDADGAPAEPQPPVDAIIDIGAERTNIVIVEGGQFRLARTIAPGGATATRALARARGVPFDEAEALKLSLSTEGDIDPEIAAVLERASVTLIRDVRATFATFTAKSKRKIDRVLVCGGGSRLAGLNASMADALDVPVDPVVIKGNSPFPTPEELPLGALALSLALRGLGSSKLVRIDFRKGELAFVKAVGEVRSLYIRLAAMAATLVVLFAVSLWARLHALEKREAMMDDVLCETTKKILHECETDYRVALSKLKGTGPSADIPSASAIDIIGALAAAFPAGDDAVLKELDIVDETVLLRGDAKGYGAIDTLVDEIKGNKRFSDVRKGKMEARGPAHTDFTIDATYVCGNAPAKGAGS